MSLEIPGFLYNHCRVRLLASPKYRVENSAARNRLEESGITRFFPDFIFLWIPWRAAVLLSVAAQFPFSPPSLRASLAQYVSRRYLHRPW
jgi:hypothetical protein